MTATSKVSYATKNMEWEADPYVFVFKDEIPGKIKMHVRSLDLKNWVRIDESYVAQMEERNKLYHTNIKDIFVSRNNETTEACKWELFQMLVQHLPERFPDIFEKKDSYIYNKVLHNSISTKADDLEDPLLRAGRLTQEDWLILEYDHNQLGYVLTAGLLCFPMNWDLKEKYGKVLTDIHEPVQPYLEHLKDKVAKLFLNMNPKNPFWRANWGIFSGIKNQFELFIHPSQNRHQNVSGQNVIPYEGHDTGRKLFLRCEYQTMRKLPNTKCIVFSVRTYQRYLEELRHLPIDDSEDLLAAIENLSDVFLTYKGGEVWKEATVQYLKLIIKERKEKPDTINSVGIRRFNPTWFLHASMFMGILLVGGFIRKRLF